jgi:hypothetical protein
MTFTSLQARYENFTVPAYQITAGGTELSSALFTVDDVSVDLSMGETSSACRFSLYYVYEPGSRSLNEAALSHLKPGTQIQVKLGYGSDLSEVFTGYVSELNFTAGDGGLRTADEDNVSNRFGAEDIRLTAYCLDARTFMRGAASLEAYKGKAAADAAALIFAKYKPLITSTDINLEALETEISILQQSEDLTFICEAAKTRGAYFFIDCGKAVINKATDTVCVEFDWEQISVDFSVRYLNTTFVGKGYDHGKMKLFTTEIPAKQTVSQAKLLTLVRVEELPRYLLGDSGKTVIKAKAETAVREAVFGTIFCTGITEPRLAQKVKINNFPMTAAGAADTFTVISLKHMLNSRDGFLTEIGIEG